MSSEDVNKIVTEGLKVTLGTDKDLTLNEENVLISLKQKEGYASASNSKTCIVLNTELTDELLLEGLAREFVRNVQAIRKELDLVITDHINIYYDGEEKVDEMLKEYDSYIKGETLAEVISKKDNLTKEYKLNDLICKIEVEKS